MQRSLSLSRSLSRYTLIFCVATIPLISQNSNQGAHGSSNEAQRKFKTVEAGNSPMLIPIDGDGGGGGTNIYTATVPVTYNGVSISGSIAYSQVTNYAVGLPLGFARVDGSCGNADGYGYTVGLSWTNGNWGPSAVASCQYPDPTYCDTLSRVGQTSDKTFYWPDYLNSRKPHYVYITVNFGYNTDSKYWMYSSTSDPLYPYDPSRRISDQFYYWSKRSTGGGDGYRLGPFLFQEVPTSPSGAGVKTTYERASSYLFGAGYGSSCLRSAELYEAIPVSNTYNSQPFSFNVGLGSGENIVDIPLWGLEGKNIDLNSVTLPAITFKWVTETKSITVNISQYNLDRLYSGSYDAWVQSCSKLGSYEMPYYKEPSVTPQVQLSSYELIYKGKFPHLRVKVVK